MEYKQTVTIQVACFLFGAITESEAIKVKSTIEGFDGLHVIDSFKTDDNLLVIVKGLAGNREDYVIKSLLENGIESRINDDIAAKEIINAEFCIEYPNLKSDLSSSWD